MHLGQMVCRLHMRSNPGPVQRTTTTRRHTVKQSWRHYSGRCRQVSQIFVGRARHMS